MSFLAALPNSVRAAEGDPIWSINPLPVFGGIYLCISPTFNTDVVNSNNIIVGSCVDIFAANNSTVAGLNPANGATVWTKPLPFTVYNLAWGGKPLVTDSTGLYVGGGIPWSGTYREVIEKRSLVDGSVIWSKSGPNCNAAYCPGLYYNDLVLDGTGHLYATQPNGGAGTSWSGILTKFNASNGNVVWSASSLYAAYLDNLIVDNNGIYISGSYISSGAVYAANQRAYFYQKFDPNSGASLWLKNGVTGEAESAGSIGLAGGSLYTGLIKWLPPAYTTGTGEVRKIDTASGNTLDSFTDDVYTNVRKGDVGGFYFGHEQNFYGTVAPPVYKKRSTSDMSLVWSAPVRPSVTVHRASDFYALTGTTMERRSLANGSLLWSKGIASDPYYLSYLTHDGTYLYGLFADAGWNFTYMKMNTEPESSACGSSHGVSVSTIPAPTPSTPPNNLCTGGSAPTITDSGSSFDWTCDGPDNFDATADDVSCSAPKIFVALSAPTNFLATPWMCGTGRIGITWDGVAGASGYDLQIDGGAWLSLGNITSYTHSGLIADSTHTYSVRAWDVNGPGTASVTISQNAPSVCPTCAAATVNNCILSSALDGETVDGSCVATHVGDCNFTCSSPNWNENGNSCVRLPNPPIITVTVTPTLVRSGEIANVTVEVNDPVSDLSCTVLGVNPTGTPDLTTFNHEPSVTLDPITNKSYVTKTLTSTQLIQVSCTHVTLGITTSIEKRVNVVPTIQEI